MKILFANGRRGYPLFQGGDAITIDSYLHYLYKDNHDVLSIGKVNNGNFPFSVDEVVQQLKEKNVVPISVTKEMIHYKIAESYPCSLFTNEKFDLLFEQYLQNEKPDLLITQQDYSHRIISMAYQLDIKVILFVHDHHPLNFVNFSDSHKIAHVIFNSKSTQGHFAHLLKCPSSIIYSPLLEESYLSTREHGNYITMINPTQDKGGQIVAEVIRQMPTNNFLLVSGWTGISREFFNYKNVTTLEMQGDMRQVYERTKLLLIPSQVEEAFGRVAIEAMINKIPVIASNIGGLPESVGDGGILINEFTNYNEWVKSIQQLLTNAELYQALGAKGFEHARLFNIQNWYPKLKNIIESLSLKLKK